MPKSLDLRKYSEPNHKPKLRGFKLGGLRKYEQKSALPDPYSAKKPSPAVTYSQFPLKHKGVVEMSKS